jgi:hypothetical protein
MPILRGLFLAGCLLAVTLAPLSATSIFVEGVLVEIKPDGTVTVHGFDHYNSKKYEDKIAQIPVKFAKNCVFLLDGRILDRELVLATGRHVYAIGSSAGAMIFAALSEPADRLIGEVVKAEGGALTLKVVIGADSFEAPVTLAADAVGVAEAAVGKRICVLPARPLTVLAFTPAKVGVAPAGTPEAVGGVLAQAGADPTVTAIKAGAVEQVVSPGKRSVLFDVSGFPGHGPSPELTAGMPAALIAFEKRPGKVDRYLVAQAVDAGRCDGVVTAAEAGAVTVAVVTPGATSLTDQRIALPAGAVVRLDGAESPATALMSGQIVSVFAARPQTIVPVAPAPAPAPH